MHCSVDNKSVFPFKVDKRMLADITRSAGSSIMDVYQRNDKGITIKGDSSPLTHADNASQEIIVSGLAKNFPAIPVLSEEKKAAPFEERKQWEYFWLIDPLDGTKEFIRGIPEFVISIALIHQGRPILGAIYAPVQKDFFYAAQGKGACKIDKEGREKRLSCTDTAQGAVRVIVTRSHKGERLSAYLDALCQKHGKISRVSVGSALKFAFLAQGKVDLYPRFAPTMEWDTAAGQIIVEEAGGALIDLDTKDAMRYNKESLVNHYFFAYNRRGHRFIEQKRRR